jgi:hypothetical protein
MPDIEVSLWEEAVGIIRFTPVPNSGERSGILIQDDADYSRALKAIADDRDDPRRMPMKRPRILLDQALVRKAIERRRKRLQAIEAESTT